MSRPLLVLMSMVGLLLMMSVGNIANILIARMNAREKEVATRRALGASGYRLLAQLTTESVVVACLAAGFGLLLAPSFTEALVTLSVGGRAPDDLLFRAELRVLVFTAVATLLVGLLCGLAPALRALRTEPARAMKDGDQAGRGTRRGLRMGKSLVVAQVALSVVLVVYASLLVQSFEKLNSLDAGFRRDNILLTRVEVAPGGPSGERLDRSYEQLLERVRSLPGVRIAGVASESFFSGTNRLAAVFVRGAPVPSRMEDVPLSRVLMVSPDFFEAMGITLVRGRRFTAGDISSSPKIAIISESLARRHFPNHDPIGQRFGKDRPELTEEIEVVGVVKDIKLDNLRIQGPHTYFLPLLQTLTPQAVTLVIRTVGNPASLQTSVEQLVVAGGLGLSVVRSTTQQRIVDDSLRQERLLAALSSTFGIFALLLACVGVFGIVSYTVARRTAEFGLRIALGAAKEHVSGLVLRETVAMLVVGLTLGTAAALATTRLLSTLIYDLRPTDPISIGGSLLLVVTVAVLGAAIPAWRASRVDPIVALRYE